MITQYFHIAFIRKILKKMRIVVNEFSTENDKEIEYLQTISAGAEPKIFAETLAGARLQIRLAMRDLYNDILKKTE